MPCCARPDLPGFQLAGEAKRDNFGFAVAGLGDMHGGDGSASADQLTAPGRGPMGITLEELLKALNKDLEWEFAAAIQYTQHAAVITGAKYESIQKELLVHAQEEIQHARMLAEQINYLGGTPTANVEKREVSPDSLEMLKQDLSGEQQAIDGYKERIAQAESLREYGLRRVLEDILIQEEEHKRDLLTVVDD
jgi:bacterioferritin